MFLNLKKISSKNVASERNSGTNCNERATRVFGGVGCDVWNFCYLFGVLLLLTLAAITFLSALPITKISLITSACLLATKIVFYLRG